MKKDILYEAEISNLAREIGNTCLEQIAVVDVLRIEILFLSKLAPYIEDLRAAREALQQIYDLTMHPANADDVLAAQKVEL